MKTKIIIVVTVVSMMLFTMAPQSLAGAKQHYRWEGAAIALGSLAALGIVSALIAPPPPTVIYHPPVYSYSPYSYSPPPAYLPPPPTRWMPGHWEIQRMWEPETWTRVWVPSHYDSAGNWIQGHWEERRSGGGWVERWVWIPGHYR